LLTSAIPLLENLKKEGEQGRRKINQYTRYATVALAVVQGYGISSWLMNSTSPDGHPLVTSPIVAFLPFQIMTIITLTAGTCFIMWLGEQITERGLGNGISIIIFAGIAAGLPGALGGLASSVSNGSIGALSAIIIMILVVAVTFFVVFVERGQRKILVNYAKRQVGNKIYGGQTSHLPLKLNMAGVIPPIFASSIILFPATIVGWFTTGADTANPAVRFLKDLAASMGPGEPIHALLYAIANRVFLFLLYSAGLQQQRNSG